MALKDATDNAARQSLAGTHEASPLRYTPRVVGRDDQDHSFLWEALGMIYHICLKAKAFQDLQAKPLWEGRKGKLQVKKVSSLKLPVAFTWFAFKESQARLLGHECPIRTKTTFICDKWICHALCIPKTLTLPWVSTWNKHFSGINKPNHTKPLRGCPTLRNLCNATFRQQRQSKT